MADSFRMVEAAIDPAALKLDLVDAAAGAAVCFEGWVRDHHGGESVAALEYEAHKGIAESEGDKILAEARKQFDILAAHGRHRTGKLEIGDCAVWVGVSAAHRGAAFDACRYIIDELKARVPIWKKEHYVNGPSGWVNCATRGAKATSSAGA
jgi:molybdopterin synthase catalytic subunit